MQIHLVFYIYFKSTTENDPFFGQKLEPKTLVLASNIQYKVYVNSILDSRINKQQKNLL